MLVVPLWLVELAAVRIAAAASVPVTVKLTEAPVEVVAVTVYVPEAGVGSTGLGILPAVKPSGPTQLYVTFKLSEVACKGNGWP